MLKHFQFKFGIHSHNLFPTQFLHLVLLQAFQVGGVQAFFHSICTTHGAFI